MARSWWFVALALLTLIVLASLPPPASAAEAPRIQFGMDRGSVGAQAGMGIKPQYGQFWAGAWNERSGWWYLGDWADQLADQGVKPVVQWYYWAGDISVSCISEGCWGGGVWKDQSRWWADGYKLADELHRGLKGRPGLLVIETEFNLRGVDTWETFDGILASYTKIFRERAPELQLAIGFGNWNPWNWGRFDRAAAAVDVIGFQTMRGSTRDSEAKYLDTVDSIKAATVQLRNLFHKPVHLYDLALSSYWEPQWALTQERVFRELGARLPELRSAGLAAIVLRALDDDPDFTDKEYFGVAERWMGLRRADGSWKPALNDWIAAVKAERGGTSVGSALPSTGTAGTTFTPKSLTNNWWIEVLVTSGSTIAKVEAQIDGAGWVSLPKTSWGTWAKSLHAPDGSQVRFRAWNTAGESALSAIYTWGAAAPAGFSATFTPKSAGNDWWVEVKVASASTVTKVEAQVNDGSWVSLPKTSWGTWAESLHAPDGSKVEFRAWNTAGASAVSSAFAWP